MNVVAHDGCIHGRALVFPVGEQLVEPRRLKAVAGQNVRANFGAFLDHHNGQTVIQF